MIIGKLITRELQDHESEDKEIGFFELTITLEEKLINTNPDPKGYVRHTIALYLASAIKDTEVPQMYWAFIPVRSIRKAFNFPEIMPFG